LPPSASEGEQAGIDSVQFNEWMGSHFALAELLILPLLTIASFIVFYKRGYNFFEHAILNCYVIGQRVIANFLAFPFMIAYSGTQELNRINYIVILVNIFIVFWTYSQFFGGKSRIQTFFLTVLTYLFLFVEMFALIYGYVMLKQ
jgi:hypothetical protein